MEMKKPWRATLIRAPLSCLAPLLRLNRERTVPTGWEGGVSCDAVTFILSSLFNLFLVSSVSPHQSSTWTCFHYSSPLEILFHDILCTLGADPSKTPQYARGASVFRKCREYALPGSSVSISLRPRVWIF
ncbi:hypothetical protein ARMGADRAFT_533246 [Armillaria gallica]|uniref:Uncharacterized protein n=1 Tax=Armillaria gallica TaxID=47427 RepID=A0A2H3CYS0_ARMGA|nr:hypothetical protein ARMGADRAFT_533246 [Armillaria gallica]